MASWNSTPLEIISQAFGWSAFFCWSVGGYPQVILNYRRKRFFFLFFPSLLPLSDFLENLSYLLEIAGKRSVVGLNFNFVVLNSTKQLSYLIYNAVLYFSPAVQRQYREKYGVEQVFIFGSFRFSLLFLDF